MTNQKVFDENKQKDYWNKVADEKEFHSKINIDKFSQYVSKNGVILDYGCGYGRVLKELQQYGFTSLVGLDFSERMIERARKDTKDIDYVIKKSSTTIFENNHFDAVFLIFVLASVYTDKEQDKILTEIKRILKPNGHLYVCDAMITNDERNIIRYEKYHDKYGIYGVFERIEDGMIARHMSDERVEEITSNFESMSFETNIVKTQNGNIIKGFSFVGRNSK